jgi:hypothetical protein
MSNSRDDMWIKTKRKRSVSGLKRRWSFAVLARGEEINRKDKRNPPSDK